jgi:hypothetical protein
MELEYTLYYKAKEWIILFGISATVSSSQNNILDNDEIAVASNVLSNSVSNSPK